MPEPRWELARPALPQSITCSTSSPAGPCAGGGGDRAIAAEQGVVHQGGEALLQAVGVGGLGGEALVQFEQHVVGQQRLAAQVQAAGVVAGQIEQVAHEHAHALGLLLDQMQGGGLGAAAQQAEAADRAGLRSQPTGIGAWEGGWGPCWHGLSKLTSASRAAALPAPERHRSN
jgi:hypothetical protein